MFSSRRVLIANPSSLPPITKACLDLVLSEPFCRLLSHLTGLDLVHNVIRTNETTGQSSNDFESGDEDVGPSDKITDNVDNDKTSAKGTCSKIEDGLSGTNGCARDSVGSKFKEDGVKNETALTNSPLINPKPTPVSLNDAHPTSNPNTSNSSKCESSSSESRPAGLCRGDLYSWQAGSYTLAGAEDDPGLGRFCLDSIFYFCCEGM